MWELGVGAHYISDDLTLAFHHTKSACNPVNYTYSTEYLAGFTPCSFPPNHVLAQEMQFTHTEPWSHVYILPHGGLVSEYQPCVYTDVVLNVSFINWMRHLMTIRNNEHPCSCLKHTYSFYLRDLISLNLFYFVLRDSKLQPMSCFMLLQC